METTRGPLKLVWFHESLDIPNLLGSGSYKLVQEFGILQALLAGCVNLQHPHLKKLNSSDFSAAQPTAAVLALHRAGLYGNVSVCTQPKTSLYLLLYLK